MGFKSATKDFWCLYKTYIKLFLIICTPNKISENEYKQKRLQKISEEYAKQIIIIKNILIIIAFETNYSKLKNKFLFQHHF